MVVEPISHVNVWATDDELVVTWRGGSDAVSVFVSDDPDDAGVDVRAPDGPGQAVVARGTSRQYVHLFEPGQGFVVAAERRVAMDGPQNLRDIGGYPTIDGTWSRWGRVYRSDGLHGLSGPDHERIRALGITVVFDLRSEAEAELEPDRLPDGIAHHHLPMSSDVAQQRSMLQRILDGDLPKFDHDDMAEGYLRMLEGFADHIEAVVSTVADGERILFHCTAGKDRTGVMAMTLLGLAGVADPYLLDDYEISGRYRRGEGSSAFADRLRREGLDPERFETMWQSPRAVMRKTLAGLRDRWGDHDGYVDDHLGLAPGVKDRARANLRVGD